MPINVNTKTEMFAALLLATSLAQPALGASPAAPPAAEPAAMVNSIVEFRRDPVMLHEAPDRSSTSIAVPRAQLAVPLKILEEDGDFLKIRTGEGERSERWVSGLAVRLERRSVSCVALNGRAPIDYAASRGAGEKCK